MSPATMRVLGAILCWALLPIRSFGQDPARSEKDAAKAIAEAKKKDPLSFDHHVRGLLGTFCYRCHNEEKRKGDINLAKDENPRLIAQNAKVWQTALEKVESREMPPKKERQPTDAERKQLVEFIRVTLNTLDCGPARDPGRPTIRRLNRAEYNNTILEMTGLDLHLADDFSPDPTSYGFDTIGEALAVSPVLVEQYHAAARKLLSEIIDRKSAHPEAYRRMFFAEPGGDRKERPIARQILERFASAAFRRPAESAWLDKALEIYDKGRAKGETHESALRPALSAVLISPRFLMRIETARPGVQGPYPVEDYDLASRLSYFLWSGPPDAELTELAAKGSLQSPDTLEAQARRMLRDPRAQALVENFIGQWLQLRGLAHHAPDPKRFPRFTESLRTAMKEELGLFLGEILRKDRPLTELIDADYTYANEELAAHYGLDGVRGPEMRRVALPDHRRGGVLTMGAVLMVQSDPERTNIPRRGNYIAGSILGSPPPPPPANVPPLEEAKVGGKLKTLRERLEVHRKNPECANCHAKIDPLGFGLENFDAIGRWRDRDGGAPIDATGLLPNGQTFRGPVELKRILLARRDEFTRTLAENMLLYALGRGLQREDECVIRDALKAAAGADYGFSSVVVAIVRSQPFRYRRNPDF